MTTREQWLRMATQSRRQAERILEHYAQTGGRPDKRTRDEWQANVNDRDWAQANADAIGGLQAEAEVLGSDRSLADLKRDVPGLNLSRGYGHSRELSLAALIDLIEMAGDNRPGSSARARAIGAVVDLHLEIDKLHHELRDEAAGHLRCQEELSRQVAGANARADAAEDEIRQRIIAGVELSAPSEDPVPWLRDGARVMLSDPYQNARIGVIEAGSFAIGWLVRWPDGSTRRYEASHLRPAPPLPDPTVSPTAPPDPDSPF